MGLLLCRVGCFGYGQTLLLSEANTSYSHSRHPLRTEGSCTSPIARSENIVRTHSGPRVVAQKRPLHSDQPTTSLTFAPPPAIHLTPLRTEGSCTKKTTSQRPAHHQPHFCPAPRHPSDKTDKKQPSSSKTHRFSTVPNSQNSSPVSTESPERKHRPSYCNLLQITKESHAEEEAKTGCQDEGRQSTRKAMRSLRLPSSSTTPASTTQRCHNAPRHQLIRSQGKDQFVFGFLQLFPHRIVRIQKRLLFL